MTTARKGFYPRTMHGFLTAAIAGLALQAPPPTLWAQCPPESPSERVFAHPYGEPAACPDPGEKGPKRAAEPDGLDLRDEPPGRPLRALGLSGIGSGVSIAALGGVFLLSSLSTGAATSERAFLKGAGVGLAVAGGALFAAGAVLLGLDALAAPAPTPDRKGAQLLIALRF